MAELRAGFAVGSRGAANLQRFDRFLSSSCVKLLCPDEDTAKVYAQTFAQLRENGTPIPTNDIWIAAICLQHQLPLATSDQHFNKVPQLELLGAE